MLNLYHRFIPHLADILRPIYDATSTKVRKFTWTPQLASAFEDSKNALADAVLLNHPSEIAPTALSTDASATAIGAVLEQCNNGIWTPLAFFSRKLRPAETRYSTFDRELLAV